MVFMDGKALKRRVERWAKRVGPKRAQVALVTAGVGVSTAEKLVAGRYASTPKGEIAFAIEQMLKEQGETDERAS